MTLLPQTALLIGTLGGAFIGFFSSIITIWITKHYDEKRNYRRLLIETALKNWEKTTDLTKELTKETGMGASFYPLDAFILHQAKVIEAALKENLSEEELRDILEKSRKLQKVLLEEGEKYKKEKAKKTSIEQGKAG